jgi:hypothetical protein
MNYQSTELHSKKENSLCYQKTYFLAFLDIVPADMNALLASLVPLLEGGGKVLLSQGPDDPLPAVLEGLLGEGQPAAS